MLVDGCRFASKKYKSANVSMLVTSTVILLHVLGGMCIAHMIDDRSLIPVGKEWFFLANRNVIEPKQVVHTEGFLR